MIGATNSEVWIQGAEKHLGSSGAGDERAVNSRQMLHLSLFSRRLRDFPGLRPVPSLTLTHTQNVDAVYIGTPHTFHHRNAKDALLAGKHVLCEKPFTLSIEELDELIAIAKEKRLFLME